MLLATQSEQVGGNGASRTTKVAHMSFDETVYPDQLYTEQQSRILINAPRLTGTMSIIGSSVIIYIILNDKKQKLRRVYHRILLAYSVFDILCSFNYVLSSVVVPRNTPGVWGAIGNIATCEASGFVTQFTFSLGVYGTFICVYYVLVLKYNIREATIARKIEPIVHFVAIFFPLALGCVMLHKNMYNPANIFAGWCFMNCYPMDCLRREEIECQRGADYAFWVLLHNVPFVGFFACVVVSCVLTFEQVRRSERRGARWSLSQHQSRIRLRESATQAFLYIAAFFTTYVSFGTGGLLGPQPAAKENRGFYFPVVLTAKICLPLQGFFNCYIYVRPRYNSVRRKQPELPWYTVLYEVVSGQETQTRLNASSRRFRYQQSSIMVQATPGRDVLTAAKSREQENLSEDANEDFFTPELQDSRHFDAGSVPSSTQISTSEARLENEVIEPSEQISWNHPHLSFVAHPSGTTQLGSPTSEIIQSNEDGSLEISWTSSLEDVVISA